MAASMRTGDNVRNGAELPGPLVRGVIGLGTTGLSVVRHLVRMGERPHVFDTRDDPPGLTEIKNEYSELPIHLGEKGLAKATECHELIVSPGLSPDMEPIRAAVSAGAEVCGDIELFARVATAPTVAITGTNGKSTVVSMLAAITREAGLNVPVGGNLGTPALDLLTIANPDFYVLEVSSFQLEVTHALNAAVAVVLNVSPDHIDRHGSLDAYIDAKLHIFNGARAAFCNIDDPVLFARSRDFHPRGIGVLPHENAEELDYWLNEAGDLADRNGVIMPASDLGVVGQHNAMNALAAVAAADSMQVSREASIHALRRFTGLRHRCEKVGTQNDITWINDSKATNLGAAITAIESLCTGQPAVLIAGGQGKGVDFAPMADALAGRVDDVVLIGEDANVIADAIDNVTRVHHAISMEDAVAQSNNLCRAGGMVLLSPACASFDMFGGFEHRGDQFARAVAGLAKA